MVFQTIGVLGPYILIALSCIYLWIHQKITYLQYFGAGSVLNLLINSLVKKLLKEPRPKEDLLVAADISPYEFGLSDTGKRQGLDRYGMPSGHAQTTAFTLAFMAPIFESMSNSTSVSVFSPMFALYVAVATVTVVQRVACYHHTAAQIVVGLMLGGVTGVAAWCMAKRRTKKVIRAKDDDWKMLR